MRNVWKIGMGGHPWGYIALLVVAALSGVATLLQPVLTGKILNVIASGDAGNLRSIIVMLVAVLVLDTALSLVMIVLNAKVGGCFGQRLRWHTMDSLAHRQLGKHAPLDNGDVQSRVMSDTVLAVTPLIGGLASALHSGVILLGCIAGMIVLIPDLFGLLCAVLGSTALVSWLLGRWIRSTNAATRMAAGVYAGYLWHTLEDLRVLKARNAVPWALTRLEGKSNALRSAGVRTDVASGLMMPVLNIGTQIALVVSVAGATASIVRGDVAAGEGTAFIMFLLYAISPMVQLGMLLPGWSAAQASAARLAEMWSLPREHHGAGGIPVAAEPQLTFKDVSYTFAGDEKVSVRDVNVEFAGPGVTLLRGVNGSGKSTLLSLAVGLYEPAGEVRLNGVRIDTADREALRERMLLVDQHRRPIYGTVRENLGTGLDVSDKEREHAMARTGLSAQRLTLDTHLGDDGVTLSGGERSMLAMADALLRNPDVLLLDEITAGLDREMTSKIVTIIEELARKCLIVAVSHDDSLLEIADREQSLNRQEPANVAI